jgi:transcriptional antiterminator
MTKDDRATQIKIRLEELDKELVSKHMKGFNIELNEDPISEKNVRYINRMIRTIRGDNPTATGIVIEIFEIIVGLRGESKKLHLEIYESLDKQVPVSSIRRILSLYRNGKLG